METAEMLSPLKASKTQKTPSHEFCHGYVDKNGIWNNGFYCRRWGKADDKYCCDDLDVRFCCPEPSSSRPTTFEPAIVQPTTSSAANQEAEGGSILLPIIIGSGVGVALIVCCLLVVCLVCRCCAGRRRSSKPIPGNKRLSFSLEAEATSAVIAAQALQKEQQQHQQQHLLGHDPKIHHTCQGGEDGPLHCGCRWSPSTSRSTMVDLDSLIATMQQNISNSWQQQEMETTLGHPVNCPCDQHGRPFNPLLNNQNKRIFNGGDRPLNGNVSPSVTMEAFRPSSLNSSARQQQQQQQQQFFFQTEDNNTMKALHLTQDQSGIHGDRGIRGYTYSPQGQPTDYRPLKCLGSECSSDRQMLRDSGILAEEPDVVLDANSSAGNFSGCNKFPSPPPPQLSILGRR